MTRPVTSPRSPRLGLYSSLIVAGIVPALAGCDSNPGGPTSPSADATGTPSTDATKAAPSDRSAKVDAEPASDR